MSVLFVSLPALLAQAAAAPAQPSPLTSFVPLIFIFVIMYFVLIRPQQKRAKEQQSLISSAKSGDEIVTSGGLHGIISNARDPESKTVLVKFAENVKMEVDKSAITSVTKASATNRAALPTSTKTV
jgi:preprotein translocase subunit YajC